MPGSGLLPRRTRREQAAGGQRLHTEMHLMLEPPVGRLLDPNRMLLVLNQEHGLGVTYRRLWGAAVAGAIPAYRDGRAWRFAERDKEAIAGHFRPRPNGSSVTPSAPAKSRPRVSAAAV